MRRLVACLAIITIVTLTATPAVAADSNRIGSADSPAEFESSVLSEYLSWFTARLEALFSLGETIRSLEAGPAGGGQASTARRIGPTMDPNGALDPRSSPAPAVATAVQHLTPERLID